MGYHTLYSNTMTGANQNPLDPTNWTCPYTGKLQVYNAQCCASTNYQGVGYMNSINLTADQWCQWTVATVTPGDIFYTFLRCVYGTSAGYEFWAEPYGSATDWAIRNPSNSLVGAGTSSGAMTAGDVFFMSCIGSTITFKRNGTTLFSGTDTTSDLNGVPYLNLEPNSVYTDTGIIDFTAGSYNTTSTISGNAGVAGATVSWTGTSSGTTVSGAGGSYSIPNLSNGSYTITPALTGYTFSPTIAAIIINGHDVTQNFTATAVPTVWSQIDSRNFGNFPNNAVNVNSTETYTVQKYESRKAGAPVDSRKSKPVPSKKSYPQNSRTTQK